MTTTTETTITKPTFFKITRAQMDQVTRVGSKEYLEQELPKLTMEQLKQAESWVAERYAEKTKDTFLVFPVSKPKQINAGKLYLGRLGMFKRALDKEIAKRTTEALFGLPVVAA